MTYRYKDKPKKHWAKLVEPEEEDRYSSEGFAEGGKYHHPEEKISKDPIYPNQKKNK